MSENFNEKLSQGDRSAIHTLYQNDFSVCASFILSNKGSRVDAKDLFQEAVVVLINNLKKKDFELRCSTATYLYSIVRNLWLKRLNSKHSKQVDLIVDHPDYNFVLVDEDEIEEKTEIEEKHLLIAKLLKNDMKEDCRKVITAFYFQKKSMKDIAKMMGYSDKFVRVKKNRCMDRLRKMALQEYKQ